MFDKLEDLLIRYEEIMGELQEPDVVNDQSRFRKLMKEHIKNIKIVNRTLKTVFLFWRKNPMKR